MLTNTSLRTINMTIDIFNLAYFHLDYVLFVDMFGSIINSNFIGKVYCWLVVAELNKKRDKLELSCAKLSSALASY